MKVLQILQSYYWRLALGILLIPTCNIAITQKRVADINQFIADLKAKRITNVAQIETRQKQLKAGLSSRELQSRQLKDMDRTVQAAITALTPPKAPEVPTLPEEPEIEPTPEKEIVEEIIEEPAPKIPARPSKPPKPEVPPKPPRKPEVTPKVPPVKPPKPIQNGALKKLADEIHENKIWLSGVLLREDITITREGIQTYYKKLTELSNNLKSYASQENTTLYQKAFKDLDSSEDIVNKLSEKIVKPGEEQVPEKKPKEPEEPKLIPEEPKILTLKDLADDIRLFKQWLEKTIKRKDLRVTQESIENLSNIINNSKNILATYDNQKNTTFYKNAQKDLISSENLINQFRKKIGKKPEVKLGEEEVNLKEAFEELFGTKEKAPEEELIEKGKKELAPEQKLSDEISERVKTVLAQIDDLSANSSKDDIDKVQNSLIELNNKYAQYQKLTKQDNKVLRDTIDKASHNFDAKGLEILNQIAAPILADIKKAKDALPNIQIKDTTFANFNKLILFSGYFNNQTHLYDAQAALNGYMADATQKILLLEDIRTPGRLLTKLNQINAQYTKAILENPELQARQDQYKKLFEEKEATLRKNLEQQIDAAITNGTIQRWLDNVRWAFITDLVVKMENLRKKENINVDDTLLPAYLVPYYEQLDIAKNNPNLSGVLRQQIIGTQKFMVDGFKQYIIDFLIRMRELTGLEELHIAVQAKDDPTAREKVKKILPQSTNNLSKMLADLKDLNAWDESNQLDRRIEFEATRSFAYILAAHDAFEKAIFYNYTTWEQIWQWIKYILYSVAGGTRLGDKRPGTNFQQYKWYVSAINGVETALQNIITLYNNLITKQIGKNENDTDPRLKGIGLLFKEGKFSPIQTYRYPINGKTLHYVPENVFIKNGEYIYKQNPITINSGIFQGHRFLSPRITGLHKKEYNEIMDTFKLQLQEAWGISPEDAATVVIPANLLDEGARVDAKGNPVL